MNPLTNVKNITKLNELELSRGTVDKKSWHDMYKDSAWIFIGGLAYGLTEGDILSVFSQYGEIVNINLIRDAKTGKIKGFCFLCYANQKSTVLAVDNFNGIKLCGRTIRVDHVSNYKPPKEHENDDELTKQLKSEGCAPRPIKLENDQSPIVSETTQQKKKSKKVKKEKKKHKKKRKHDSSKEETRNYKKIKVKEEKFDPGYAKNELSVKEKNTKRRNKQKNSSDSEECSSDSDSTDSESNGQQMSRKEDSSHKHKIKQSENKYKEKYDDPRSRISNEDDSYKRSEIAQKERDVSSSGSYNKLHKHKRYQNEDYSKGSSSKSKYYQPSDQHDDHCKDYSDLHKNKHSSEYKKSDLKKRQRRDSASSSESDMSEKEKSSVRDKQNEKHIKSHYKHDEERYSKSQNRHKSSSYRREDKSNERKSRHERDH